MHEIADCLHARPAGLGLTEEGPGEIEQPIPVAVSARNKKDERLLGKLVHRNVRGVCYDWIG